MTDSKNAWPSPTRTEIKIDVISADRSSTKTYYIYVEHAASEPSGAFWVPYYKLTGAPALPAVAGTSVDYLLQVDTEKWDAAFPLAANDLSAISALSFEQNLMVDGVEYPSPPSLELPLGGYCDMGYLCSSNGCCVPPPPPSPLARAPLHPPRLATPS